MNVMVGDIGGTNARLAIVETGNHGLEILDERTYPSRDFPSLEDVLVEFLEEVPVASVAHRACFGIAGPVWRNRCVATNLPWIVDGEHLARRLSLSEVHLLNDLEAGAWGLGQLTSDGIRTLEEGDSVQGNRALLAPGTGLGEAALFWDGHRHHPYATEGGHADFGPGDELQIELWRYLSRRHGHVSWERVVSGPGLVSVFRFLLQRDGREEPAWLEEELRGGDPAAAITSRVHAGRCRDCEKTLELFFGLLGAEAGNLVLRTLATGGLYLAGGIVPKFLPELRGSRFLECFTAKGRFRPLLESIPVRVVVDDRLALWGAAARISVDPDEASGSP